MALPKKRPISNRKGARKIRPFVTRMEIWTDPATVGPQTVRQPTALELEARRFRLIAENQAAAGSVLRGRQRAEAWARWKYGDRFIRVDMGGHAATLRVNDSDTVVVSLPAYAQPVSNAMKWHADRLLQASWVQADLPARVELLERDGLPAAAALADEPPDVPDDSFEELRDAG